MCKYDIMQKKNCIPSCERIWSIYFFLISKKERKTGLFCEGRKMKRVKHRVNEGKAHTLNTTTQKSANKIKSQVIANG